MDTWNVTLWHKTYNALLLGGGVKGDITRPLQISYLSAFVKIFVFLKSGCGQNRLSALSEWKQHQLE